MSKAFTWFPTIYDNCDLTAVVVNYVYVGNTCEHVQICWLVCFLVCVIFEQPPGSWYPRALFQLAWRKVTFTPSGVMKAACDHITRNIYFVSVCVYFSNPQCVRLSCSCFPCQRIPTVTGTVSSPCPGLAQVLSRFCPSKHN